MKGWRNVHRRRDDGHISRIDSVPVGDLRRHVLGDDCWCEPKRRKFMRVAIVIHNAEDGRDLIERHGLQ